MTKEILLYSAKKAAQSACKFRVAAVGFDRRGKYLGTTYNKQFKDGKGRGLHAEVLLIKRYRKSLHSIVVLRVGGKGGLLPIDPCVNCQRLADKLGIKITTLKENS